MAVATVTKRWTLEELHSLPDDGNKYELIHGDLFVTPAPTDEHEMIAARVTRILDPYVAMQALGHVLRPRSVIRIVRGEDVTEVEPDLMVRRANRDAAGDWAKAPLPILVVEIGSPSTWRRDRQFKRDLYVELDIPEYWIIDPDRRELTIVRPDHTSVVVRDMMEWSPKGTDVPLRFHLDRIWRDPDEP